MTYALKLEDRIAILTQRIMNRPRVTIALAFICCAVCMLGLPSLTIDVSKASLFHSDDPSYRQYQAFQQQFGRDDAVVAAITSANVFSPNFLEKLEAYHRALAAEVPYLDKVSSLKNVTAVDNVKGDVLVDDLKRLWPNKTKDVDAFKAAVVNNPLYRNLIVSADGSTTLVVINAVAFAHDEQKKSLNWHDRIHGFFASADDHGQQSDSTLSNDGLLDLDNLPAVLQRPEAMAGTGQSLNALTTQQLNAFINGIKGVTAQHHSPEFDIRLAGGQMIDAEHNDSIHNDLLSLVPVIFLIVFIVLYLIFRRLSIVFTTLLIVTLSLLSTLGMMGWISAPITPIAVAVPPLILTIGVVDAIHILSLFFSRYKQTGQKKESLMFAMRRTTVAILLTSLTTAAGFLSFSIVDIKSIADFGMIIAFGVMMAFFLSIVLIPAIISLMNVDATTTAPTADPKEKHWSSCSAMLTTLSTWAYEKANWVVMLMIVLTAVMLPGLSKTSFSHDILSWFPEENSVRINTLALDKKFSGSIPLEVIINTGELNGIHSPEFMQKLAAFQRYTESLSSANIVMGRTSSIIDVLRRIHFVLHDEQPSHELPQTAELIAQELVLFESGDKEDFDDLVDGNYSMARVTVRMSWADAVDFVDIRQRIESKARALFPDVESIAITGSVDLVTRSLFNVITGMSSSYLIVAMVIGLMLLMLTRRFFLGLLCLVPNVLPIIITLGVMGYAGYPINMFTVLLGGIALGLSVDDTVHFIHGYQYYRYDQGQPTKEAIVATVSSAGPALLFTTFTITVGFLVFMLSIMDVLFYFGLLLGLTIINAFLVDIVGMPALLRVSERGFKAINVKKDVEHAV